MPGMIDGLKHLSSIGGKFLKTTAIEMYLDTYHADVIANLSMILKGVTPEDVKQYVEGGMALPIPEVYFKYLKGFEDYIEKFDPSRLFEYIHEANPMVAAAIMDMGDAGVNYIVNFKKFVLDSVKNAVPDEPPEDKATETPEDISPANQSEETPEEPVRRMTRIPFKIAGEDKPLDIAPPRMKRVTCDECGESWEIPEKDIPKLTECPFCHASA